VITTESVVSRDDVAKEPDGLVVRAMPSPASSVVLIEQDHELLGSLERRMLAEVFRKAAVLRD
jgi:hypothetical protein